MDLSVSAFLTLLLVVALLRFVELRISRRHQQDMVARGAAQVAEAPSRRMALRLSRPFWVLFFAAAGCPASSDQDGDSPAFKTVPELASGFHLLYAQDFPQAREKFDNWESQHPEEPFGEVAVAASYLFEELFRQGVLSSDFFLNEKRFLHGIEGKPDPARMKRFQDALHQARKLAKNRVAKNNRDPEALFALTL